MPTWDYSWKVTDVMIGCATLLGPVLAVQAQRVVDRLRSARDEQVRIFHALMATRATPVAPKHVEALNSIPIVFHPNNLFLGWARPGRGELLKTIAEAWRTLLNHYDQDLSQLTDGQSALWLQNRDTYEVQLLSKIGGYLGYAFPDLDIKTQVYFPVSHGNAILDEDAIRTGMARVFRGEARFPINVELSQPANGQHRTEPTAPPAGGANP
ncbi:DUF6680 family protein [Pandoraea commovens]|uniref:DUF6680 domain-containing protein n=1 Tax=Pandoraea commovens TaxID=2508289 RepID=A0A5E4SL15_9BURK|nr:DUF6680 family protein [Pandoraea commovens]VVD74978.1 hypothetical protein PCO31010_00827 [Pandoraea commovens]